MQLGNFLSNVPPSTGSAKKTKVEFVVVGMNSQAQQVETKAYACFRLVSDKDHEEADLAALKSIKDASPDGMVPHSLMTNRERAHFLTVALRDYDDPAQRFAENAEQLQRAVSRLDLQRIEREYEAWVAKNYPTSITGDQRQEMKTEAVGK